MASVKDEYERKTISISIPIEVLQKLDNYSKRLHITRSAALTSLLVQALDQSSAIEIMAKLMEKYETLEQLKTVDNDDF